MAPMVVIGIDPHKSTHTAVAVDQVGARLTGLTVPAGAEGLLRLRVWASRFTDHDLVWAVEDGRGVAGALIRALLATGDRIVLVPPKLMAACRASARTRGKSDPIDALAIARAVLREPDLPAARLDPAALDIRLLADRREHLVGQRTTTINRLRWHLHDLDAALDTAAGLTGPRRLRGLDAALRELPAGVRRDLALDLVAEITALGERIRGLEHRLAGVVTPIAPALLAVVGISVVTAAAIIGQVGGIDRFRTAGGFAMHAGVAPIPVWSSGKPQYRLNRGGNRQLNACLHRVVITQLAHHEPARALRDRWVTAHPHASGKAALRVLKRHLSDVVYQALKADSRLRRDPLPKTA